MKAHEMLHYLDAALHHAVTNYAQAKHNHHNDISPWVGPSNDSANFHDWESEMDDHRQVAKGIYNTMENLQIPYNTPFDEDTGQCQHGEDLGNGMKRMCVTPLKGVALYAQHNLY